MTTLDEMKLDILEKKLEVLRQTVTAARLEWERQQADYTATQRRLESLRTVMKNERRSPKK